MDSGLETWAWRWAWNAPGHPATTARPTAAAPQAAIFPNNRAFVRFRHRSTRVPAMTAVTESPVFVILGTQRERQLSRLHESPPREAPCHKPSLHRSTKGLSCATPGMKPSSQPRLIERHRVRRAPLALR